jgi:hypothetical protein
MVGWVNEGGGKDRNGGNKREGRDRKGVNKRKVRVYGGREGQEGWE